MTGASSGIGEQIARALAARGATLAFLARRADRHEAIAQSIQSSGGKARAYAVDVTDAGAIAAVAQGLAARFGDAGIVVNDAGVMLPTSISELDSPNWATRSS